MEHCSHPVFQNLAPVHRDAFLRLCRELVFAPGAEVIARGERGQYVYFLTEGELSVRLPERRSQQELSRLSPPAVVGEMEMLTGQPRTASVVCLTTVKMLAVSIELFRQKIEEGDLATLLVVANIARTVALRLGSLTEQLVELEKTDPAERSVELQRFQSQLFSDWST